MIIRKSESTICPTTVYRVDSVIVPSDVVRVEREFDDIKETIYTCTETVYELAEWQKLKDEEVTVTQEAINFLLMGGM